MNPIDFKKLRTQIIISIFSDDMLLDTFIVKGGCAIDIVHGVTDGRSSLDLDMSISDDFTTEQEFKKVKERFEKALKSNLNAFGLVPVNFRSKYKPSSGRPGDEKLGGYYLSFELVEKSLYDKKIKNYSGDNLPKGMTRVHLPNEKSKFEIDISKCDIWNDDIVEYKDVMETLVPVYSPKAICAEKLRAICEKYIKYEKPRAKDFYDICLLTDVMSIDWSSNEMKSMVIDCFNIKSVPLETINIIENSYKIQRLDFDQVSQTLDNTSEVQDFDHYFQRVMDYIKKLKPFGNE